MAYLKDIELPRCRSCGHTAYTVLHNKLNQETHTYCRTCGPKALERMLRAESPVIRERVAGSQPRKQLDRPD